jgi:hypothetical protein
MLQKSLGTLQLQMQKIPFATGLFFLKQAFALLISANFSHRERENEASEGYFAQFSKKHEEEKYRLYCDFTCGCAAGIIFGGYVRR